MDLKYPNTDNLLHEKLYPAVKATFFIKTRYRNLNMIVNELKKQNFKFIDFCHYQPYSITEEMQEKVKDEMQEIFQKPAVEKEL